MLKNYLKYAFRRLRKTWGYSAVNVFGLAAGMATCFLIFFYVHFESTYDRFIPESKDKFRVALRISGEDATWEFAQISAPAAVAFRDQYPQVEQAVRFIRESNKQVTSQDRVYQEDQVLFSDPEFIPFFGIKLSEGNPETALSSPGTLLITEAMCRKYFGDGNPLGRRLRIDDTDYEVTGVIPDAPNNSHIPYRFIASFDRFEGDQAYTKTNWTRNNCFTYVELVRASDPRVFEEQIQSVADQLESPGWDYRYFLQNVTDIHLRSKLGGELKPPGNPTNLLILSIIGSFVFFIACFNFVNLSTARSIKRATEVGIRKVVGATRMQLVQQFTGEAVLVILVALIGAVGIAVSVFPVYQHLVGLSLRGQDILKPVYLVFLGALTLIAGLGAGSYPAFFMARFSPEQIIKGVMPSGAKSHVVRKALVTLQFAVASLLVICALLINRQISFMKDQQNFGFETDRRIILRVGMGGKYAPSVAEGLMNRVMSLKDEFSRHPTIEQVSVSTTVPGRGMIQNAMRKPDEDWTHKRPINYLGVDFEFLPQYGIELAAGRMLDRTMPSDAAGAVLINETAAKTLGWASPEDALNTEIVLGGDETPRRIVGVVRDFHYMGLQSPIEPLVLQHFLAGGRPIGYFTLSVKAGDLRETVRFAEKTWSGLFPEYPFEYFFLDDDFKRFYGKEERLGQMIGALTFLGIFITGLGLWGLSSLSTEQRIKEIGIRKIMGASVPGIILLLSKDFLKWVLAANVIAWPIGYFVLNDWLRNFAYRTEVTPFVFALSTLFALTIALLTVSLQTRRAAQANPVESLRYE
jgi:putative ABC transport system permease protein